MKTPNEAAPVPRRLLTVTKHEVLRHFGGITARAARAMFITSQAVSMWPEDGPLPPVMRDRFQAALWRSMQAAMQPARPRRARGRKDSTTTS